MTDAEARWLSNYGESSSVKGFSWSSYHWNSKDPEKGILYKLLDKLASKPAQSTGDNERKAAAFQPANRSVNELSEEFRMLRAELQQVLRDEIRY